MFKKCHTKIHVLISKQKNMAISFNSCILYNNAIYLMIFQTFIEKSHPILWYLSLTVENYIKRNLRIRRLVDFLIKLGCHSTNFFLGYPTF